MSQSEIRVCHITILHHRYDARIFLKECRSLSKHYRTYLIVADGNGDEYKEGVHIIDAGLRSGSFLGRQFITASRIYRKARQLNCRAYHFHDPELMFWGYRLLSGARKVIYDAHEDLPRQILRKEYIPTYLRQIISKLSETALNFFTRRFSAVITATPAIQSVLNKSAIICDSICNYALESDFTAAPEYDRREKTICYIGGITEARGIRELMLSIQSIDPDVKAELAGKFENAAFRKEMMDMKSWERVVYHGFVGREEVSEILGRARIGILLLHPEHGYSESLPVKLFEYMAAGIPVIGSDFPLWKEIIEGNGCGICVDPFNIPKISETIDYLINNHDIAGEMGRNGSDAVKEKYAWSREESKLFKIYSLIGI